MMNELPGIDIAPVTQWLEHHVAGSVGPFRFETIAGGHSNLTFRVTGANGLRYVLRRPPLSQVLASAHDMLREHRIMSALQHSAVPVPPMLGVCSDISILGAPFYVMGFVDGHVIRDREAAEHLLTPAARQQAGQSLVDTLVRLHAIDIEAVGLSDLGRHHGYLERQLRRWYGQWQTQRTRDLPIVDHVHDELSRRLPEQRSVAIVHGDYRLDNCMVDDDGTVIAVLDWEICTLGDPLADLGMLMVYWNGPHDDPSAWSGSATTAAGFPNRHELARRYGEVSGRDLSDLNLYVAFAFWKLACILEGVYSRYAAGALGQREPDELATFRGQVDAAAAQAGLVLERL